MIAPPRIHGKLDLYNSHLCRAAGLSRLDVEPRVRAPVGFVSKGEQKKAPVSTAIRVANATPHNLGAMAILCICIQVSASVRVCLPLTYVFVCLCLFPPFSACLSLSRASPLYRPLCPPASVRHSLPLPSKMSQSERHMRHLFTPGGPAQCKSYPSHRNPLVGSSRPAFKRCTEPRDIPFTSNG